MTNTCISCGAEIPEGRQVCPACEQKEAKDRDLERVIRDLENALQRTEKKTDYDFIYLKVDRARTILRILKEG